MLRNIIQAIRDISAAQYKVGCLSKELYEEAVRTCPLPEEVAARRAARKEFRKHALRGSRSRLTRSRKMSFVDTLA